MKSRLHAFLTVSALALGFAASPGQACQKVDLQVSDIQLTADCKIVVTIRNNGADGLPDSAYASPGVNVQMYKGTQPWGGMVLSVFDQAKALKQPSSSAQRTWFSAANLQLGIGTHQLRVEVDGGNRLVETNENNNSLTRQVVCSKPQGPRVDQVNPSVLRQR